MKPKIFISVSDAGWGEMAADVIASSIKKTLADTDHCKIMLTGGRTAARLYERLANNQGLPMSKLEFFFGDERCVPPNHSDSNYALALKTLFQHEKSSSARIHRIEADDPDIDAASRRYEEVLPEKIDILLLGIGADGHIASLFPYDDALSCGKRTVIPVIRQSLEYSRISITKNVINNAHAVFLLATGEEKGKVLKKAMSQPTGIDSCPACLVLSATWLLDEAAARQLQ